MQAYSDSRYPPALIMTSSPSVFPVWPGTAPGSQHANLEEIHRHGPDGSVSIKGISVPTLTPFLPEKPNGTAIIILPGGGYTQLVFDKEGREFGEWLSRQGFSAFVLKHRLPVEGHADAHLVALQDAQRAIRLIRARSKDFGLDPGRIGILGASSGGHLAAAAGTAFTQQTYSPCDELDQFSARPDFMVLLYGAYTGNMYFSHASREQLFFPEAVKNRLYAEFPTDRRVGTETPPALLIAAGDDKRVSAENSTALFLALRRAGVPVQLHIYDDGGHGFALRAPRSQTISGWPAICLAWLKQHGQCPIVE